MDLNNIEHLKVVVPALSSFLGALLAGVIAVYASIKSVKLSHKNSLQTIRQNSFSNTIAESYQYSIKIVVLALRENRTFTSDEIETLSQLTIWMNKDVVPIVNKLLNEKDVNQFSKDSNLLIDTIRNVVGAT